MFTITTIVSGELQRNGRMRKDGEFAFRTIHFLVSRFSPVMVYGVCFGKMSSISDSNKYDGVLHIQQDTHRRLLIRIVLQGRSQKTVYLHYTFGFLSGVA